MFDRIAGVFGLKEATFEEIEHDSNATGQAALVVLIVALLSGAGTAFFALFQNPGAAISGLLSGIVGAFVAWLLASAITYFVGTSLFAGKADLGEMLRVIGFAMAPLALSIIPCIGWLVGVLWTMVAAFIGVRQGLDLDNTKAVLTVVIAFGVYIVGYILLSLLGVTSWF